MSPTTSTAQRPDGTFSATVNEDTCDHRHGTEASAVSCGEWEARAVAKGTSRWHASRGEHVTRSRASFDDLCIVPLPADGEIVSDADMVRSHEYVPMPDLTSLWHAVVTGAKTRPAANLMFLGPSGSGKTDGARYLAALVGLPFVKVDAASMTDPEAWFGTREIVIQDGAAVTDYRPSTFVEALQKPGVVLIDEVTRVRDEHRNVLLPLLDATRSVMNPLTGDVLYRHPQCFIIMAGNIGLHFTGTSAIDPAFMTRALTVEFDYIEAATERKIVRDASGCDEVSAEVFVRFASESRSKAASDPEFSPISTRELIEAGRLVKDGLDRDAAVKFVVLNAASGEGGSSSLRQELQNIWNGVRVVIPERKLDPLAVHVDWVCPIHASVKTVPAGVSATSGKPYNSFHACGVVGCSYTEDRAIVVRTWGRTTNVRPSALRAPRPVTPVSGNQGPKCHDCNYTNPVGRNTFCSACGGTNLS